VVAGVASANQVSHHTQRALAGPFCISKKTGVIRQVATKKACGKGEIREVGFAVKGPQGPAGATGAQGPVGATGATGIPGLQGAPGLQGLPGPQGVAGQQGPVGLQGSQGADGAEGPQGLAGVPGISSITPVVSDATCTSGGWLIEDWLGNPYEICNGTAGADGQTGTAGSQGLQGDTGPQGPQGNTGPPGPQGDTGPQGQAGTTAIYNSSGTSQTSPHIVEGTAVTNVAGNGSVTFTGSAVFTSAVSYVCTLTAESTGPAATNGAFIASKSSTSFTFKSTLNSTTFDYVCVGN
jgi:hypothetical protein